MINLSPVRHRITLMRAACVAALAASIGCSGTPASTKTSFTARNYTQPDARRNPPAGDPLFKPIASWEAAQPQIRKGIASWYGGGEPLNSHTASGEPFNAEELEAAMWDVPFGTQLRVTNLANGRSIVVRVTDRGPNRRFEERVIDLTRAAFARLAPLEAGLIPVEVTVAQGDEI